MSDLAAALQVAIRVHAAQTDKLGRPYLLHVLKVVEAVSPEAKVVAALHDVQEDGGPEGCEAVLRLDLGPHEGAALWLLTREKYVSYEQYIGIIAVADLAAGDLAREVKIADLTDNLARIPPEPPADPDPLLTHDRWVRERAWVREWSGLKRRYERALQTLGAEVPA